VLPAGSVVKGWKQIGATRLYNANNLFDLIDGEAQAVLAYAFAGCAHGEYGPAGQSRPAITVDVYDMSDPLNAFGLFGSDRISGKPIAIGAEGVQIGKTGLSFWKGRYVVRMAIVAQGQVTPANQASQMALARAVAAKIRGSTALPPLVQALPPGRKPRSEKYVRGNVAGHAFLKDAITAAYPGVGLGAELFIARYPSPAAARSALEAYRTYEKSGKGLTPVKGVGETAFRVVDKYQKNVVVAQKGKYVIGVIRARDAAGARKLVQQAIVKAK